MCKFAERATRACWLVGAIAVPVLVMPMIYGGYGLPKAVLLQVLTAMVIAAWMIGMASPTAPHRKSPGASSGSSPYRLDSVFSILRSPVALAGLGFLASQLLATACSLSPRISFWGGHGRWQGAVANLCGYIVMLTLPLGARSRKDVEAMISAILWGSTIVVAVGLGPISLACVSNQSMGVSEDRLNSREPDFPGGIPRPGYSSGGGALDQSYSFIPLEAFIFNRVALRGIYTVTSWAGCVFVAHRKSWPLARCGRCGFGILYATRLAPPSTTPGDRLSHRAGCSGSAASFLQHLGCLLEGGGARTFSESVALRSRFWVYISTDTGVESNLGHDTAAASNRTAHDAIGWLRHVVGYGPETTQFTFWTVFPLELFDHSGSEGLFDRVHNRLLEVTLTSGLLGLMTFIAFIAMLGGCLIRQLKSEDSLERILLPLALLSAVVGHFLELQTGIEQIETQTLLWVYAGLAITLSRRDVWVEVPSDNAQSESLVEVPLSCVAIRGRVVGYTALAVALSVLLVVVTAMRGGRQIAAAHLYMTGRDFHPNVSDSLRLDLLNRTVALAPYEPLYYRAKFALHFRLSQRVPDTDVAMKNDILEFGADAIEQAIRLAPYERLYHINRAEIYGYWAASIAPERFHEAVESWERAIEITPWDTKLRVDLGELCLETDHLEEAKQILHEAIELDPRNGESYYVLGLVYREMGQEELAREQFEIGYSVDSGCSECEAELRSPRR